MNVLDNVNKLRILSDIEKIQFLLINKYYLYGYQSALYDILSEPFDQEVKDVLNVYMKKVNDNLNNLAI